MESPKLGPRVKLFQSFSSLNTLTLGFRDSITQVWPEIERLSNTFAVAPFKSFFFQADELSELRLEVANPMEELKTSHGLEFYCSL